MLLHTTGQYLLNRDDRVSDVSAFIFVFVQYSGIYVYYLMIYKQNLQIVTHNKTA